MLKIKINKMDGFGYKQSSNISQDISRVALILFSELIINNKKKIYLLLAKSNVSGCVTTLGGRKDREKESDIDCVIRETRQESRGILNYEKIPDIFNQKSFVKLTFKECIYFCHQVEYKKLNEICETFRITKQVESEIDEISDLNLYDIDKLILDINSENKIHNYHPVFANMFLSIGYDFFKKITCNKESKKMGLEGKLYKQIFINPDYVSLQPELITNAPNLYGEVFHSGSILYIYDQYYGKFGNIHLFRKNTNV